MIELDASTMAAAESEFACVSPEKLTAFLNGQLIDAARSEVEAHLARCAECRRRLSVVAGALPGTPRPDDTLRSDEAIAWPTLPGTAATAELGVGATVGRYVVQHRLGAGGMGVVYAAFDPELGRKVALKLLRSDAVSAADRSMVGDRLLREAQAMARLAHPNVVVVHDVGTVGDNIFVAMELVEGQTLAQWLRTEPRAVPEVIAQFLQAGQGLAAAHTAGLVHRDFKPENVLVGSDGRVRVGDFGLARWTLGLSAPAAPEADLAPAEAHATLPALTRTGELMGTPFYMAPEQYRAEAIDARTDQFSFCVALHAAISGVHPFAADDAESLAEAVTRGRLRPPSRPDPMPRWLRRVVARGLSVEPAARFPSMAVLLAALRRDPKRLRRRIGLAAGLVLVLATGGALYRMAAPPQLCTGSERKLAGVWDDGRMAAVQRRFAVTGMPYAAAAFAETSRVLGTFAKAWTSMHTEACEATHIRGEQPQELFELRMMCLDTRLRELRAMTDRMVNADAELVRLAPAAVHRLGDLSTCADPAALSSKIRPPKEATARARVAELRGRLAELRATRETGHYRDACEGMRKLIPEVQATQYRPLEAEALFLLGVVEYDCGDAKASAKMLEQAVWAAEAGGHDEVAARAWTRLMYNWRADARFQEALALEPRVTAVIERMGGHDELEGTLRVTMGQLLDETDRHAEAQAELERGLLLLERSVGADDLRVANALENLGTAVTHGSGGGAARPHYERALAIKKKIYGGTHPEVAIGLGQLANAVVLQQGPEQAIPLYEEALSIGDSTLGPEHPFLFGVLNNMAAARNAMNQPEEALPFQLRASVMGAKLFGSDHPTYAVAVMTQGGTLHLLGRFEEALVKLREALAVFERKLGPTHHRVATCRDKIARALYYLGRHAEARREALATLAIFEQREDVAASGVLRLLGQIDLKLGKPLRAVSELERARAIERDDPDSWAFSRAQTEFALAQALVAAGQSRARARELALSARAVFVADPNNQPELGDLDRWLARQGWRPRTSTRPRSSRGAAR